MGCCQAVSSTTPQAQTQTHVFPCCLVVAAVPAGTTELRVATVQKQGDIVLMTLAGQMSSAAQLLQVSA